MRKEFIDTQEKKIAHTLSVGWPVGFFEGAADVGSWVIGLNVGSFEGPSDGLRLGLTVGIG